MSAIVSGIPQVVRAMDRVIGEDGAVISAVRDAIKVCALDLQGKSQRLAPKAPNTKRHRGGTLRGSATVTLGPRDAEPYALVSFNTPYARRQHEELRYRHVNGQAKYLSGPFMANEDKYRSYIASAISDAVRKATAGNP